MSLKENNEITLKIKCELNEFYEIMKKKGFKVIDKFRLDDTYFIPKDLKLNKTNIRWKNKVNYFQNKRIWWKWQNIKSGIC